MKPLFYCVKGKITIAAVLDKRSRLASGEWPVRIRVCFSKQRKYYSIGVRCTEDVWEKLPTAKSRELQKIKEEIELTFEIIRKHVHKLYHEERFSFDELKTSLLGFSGETLNALLVQKSRNYKEMGKLGPWILTAIHYLT